MRNWITDVLLGLLLALNTKKDNTLAVLLHHIADCYDTRPTEQWKYVQDMKRWFSLRAKQ